MIELVLFAGLAFAPVVRGGPATVPGAPAADAGAGLETVMVYARRIQPLTRVAATVTVIDQEQIQRAQMQDVKQLVRYEPGLSVRSDPFRFGLDTFTVRGMTGNRVSVEIDGIPSAGGSRSAATRTPAGASSTSHSSSVSRCCAGPRHRCMEVTRSAVSSR